MKHSCSLLPRPPPLGATAMTETCTKCKETKSIESFSRNKARKSGLTARCKICTAEDSRKWRKNNPGANHRWRRSNLQRDKEMKLQWDEKNRFYTALYRSHRKAKERNHIPCSATPEELRITFTGICAACGLTEKDNGQRLHMDHCHKTGRFRGWLCNPCNLTLGCVNDSAAHLQLIVSYLQERKKHSGRSLPGQLSLPFHG